VIKIIIIFWICFFYLCIYLFTCFCEFVQNSFASQSSVGP
jgi:hypothetical protein